MVSDLTDSEATTIEGTVVLPENIFGYFSSTYDADYCLWTGFAALVIFFISDRVMIRVVGPAVRIHKALPRAAGQPLFYLEGVSLLSQKSLLCQHPGYARDVPAVFP
jgi:hypothetical protein